MFANNSLGTGNKAHVHKTFGRRPESVLNVLDTFSLPPISRESLTLQDSFHPEMCLSKEVVSYYIYLGCDKYTDLKSIGIFAGKQPYRILLFTLKLYMVFCGSFVSISWQLNAKKATPNMMFVVFSFFEKWTMKGVFRTLLNIYGGAFWKNS